MNAPFSDIYVRTGDGIQLVDLSDAREFARIEAFVADMDGSLFQRPAWLRAVQAGTGQKATGLLSQKHGMVTGWLPLNEVHSPLFGRALISSGFGVGGGALATSPAIMRKLCRAAQELALRLSCHTVEVRNDAAPRDWDHWNDCHCGFIRDLAENDEEQLLSVPRRQRAEIRKGLKIDSELRIGNSEEDLRAFYSIFAISVHNLGTPVFPISLFRAMLEEFSDTADIMTVRDQGKPVASVLSFYHGGSVMPFWGGGTFGARKLRANERLHYELMCHAKRRGQERFDFGRSKVGSGPYSYKKNFGFDPEPLSYASWTAPGCPKRDLSPANEAYSTKIQMWKKLPHPVANLLGPMIAKGLA